MFLWRNVSDSIEEYITEMTHLPLVAFPCKFRTQVPIVMVIVVLLSVVVYNVGGGDHCSSL